ncbi:hypothetical protein BDW02DRAFT_576771 [Decorospora gaudefroyi]|uniref:Uncharacterized protein n=1 Tax=Decorospora gaudefroyi TaxID=184978 RepID=A0A6A5KPB4_9PLEO|nr:hypothetical protein BDW02DRAFT_576771 [Decorospora gaudefroyi]
MPAVVLQLGSGSHNTDDANTTHLFRFIDDVDPTHSSFARHVHRRAEARTMLRSTPEVAAGTMSVCPRRGALVAPFSGGAAPRTTFARPHGDTVVHQTAARQRELSQRLPGYQIIIAGSMRRAHVCSAAAGMLATLFENTPANTRISRQQYVNAHTPEDRAGVRLPFPKRRQLRPPCEPPTALGDCTNTGREDAASSPRPNRPILTFFAQFKEVSCGLREKDWSCLRTQRGGSPGPQCHGDGVLKLMRPPKQNEECLSEAFESDTGIYLIRAGCPRWGWVPMH